MAQVLFCKQNYLYIPDNQIIILISKNKSHIKEHSDMSTIQKNNSTNKCFITGNEQTCGLELGYSNCRLFHCSKVHPPGTRPPCLAYHRTSGIGCMRDNCTFEHDTNVNIQRASQTDLSIQSKVSNPFMFDTLDAAEGDWSEPRSPRDWFALGSGSSVPSNRLKSIIQDSNDLLNNEEIIIDILSDSTSPSNESSDSSSLSIDSLTVGLQPVKTHN